MSRSPAKTDFIRCIVHSDKWKISWKLNIKLRNEHRYLACCKWRPPGLNKDTVLASDQHQEQDSIRIKITIEHKRGSGSGFSQMNKWIERYDLDFFFLSFFVPLKTWGFAKIWTHTHFKIWCGLVLHSPLIQLWFGFSLCLCAFVYKHTHI